MLLDGNLTANESAIGHPTLIFNARDFTPLKQLSRGSLFTIRLTTAPRLWIAFRVALGEQGVRPDTAPLREAKGRVPESQQGY